MKDETVLFSLIKHFKQDIIPEHFGMTSHVVNIVVLIFIPMVIIHIKGHAFSLSELFIIVSSFFFKIYRQLTIFQWAQRVFASSIRFFL